MRLLLTGGTGFVGRNLLLRALDRYDEIYLPVRSREKLASQLKGEGFKAIPSSIKPILTEAPGWKFDGLPVIEHVVHSAGLVSSTSREEYFQANTEGTRTLFQQLSASARVVVLSSGAAAGPCGANEICKLENGNPLPVTWYGQSKLAMETMLAKEFSHVDYVCLRPVLVFGPRDQATLPLFKMVRSPLRPKPGLREKRYTYIAVGDLVSAVFAALEKSSKERVYYVGSDEPVSDKQMIQFASEAVARTGVLLPIPHPLIWGISRVVERIPALRRAIPNLSVDRSQEIWPDRWVVSSEKFKSDFGWRSTQDARAALRETAEWYQRAGHLPTTS